MANESDLFNDLKLAIKKIEGLRAENHDLQCQIKILKEKNEELWLSNKLQMSKIVEYRRRLEHYEDGAPNYVPNDV